MEVLDTLIGVIIGGSVAFHIGWYGEKIYRYVKQLVEREPVEDTTIVNPLPPDSFDVNNRSAIVNPKTPAQIEFEEKQRLENMQ